MSKSPWLKLEGEGRSVTCARVPSLPFCLFVQLCTSRRPWWFTGAFTRGFLSAPQTRVDTIRSPLHQWFSCGTDTTFLVSKVTCCSSFIHPAHICEVLPVVSLPGCEAHGAGSGASRPDPRGLQTGRHPVPGREAARVTESAWPPLLQIA